MDNDTDKRNLCGDGRRSYYRLSCGTTNCRYRTHHNLSIEVEMNLLTIIAAFVCIYGVATMSLGIILLSLVIYEIGNGGRGLIAWWISGREK